MNRFTGLPIIIASIIALSLIVIGGCSSSQSNPVSPLAELPDLSPLINNENLEDSNHNLLGTWTATFDIQSMSATIAPDRTLNAHWNVTAMLPMPSIAVTGYDPVTEVIEVDVTITNPFDIDVNDVRLIIYTDSTGNRLMNPDNWIGLYDIPGGLPVNPFRAYEKDVFLRLFEGLSEHTCNLSIHIPGGNVSVTFAIAASYPGNCEEPYKIYLLLQLDKLIDQIGSSVLIEARVSDYQKDIDSVELYCPAITGEILIPFNQNSEYWDWELELVNATGAPVGEYPAWVLASSGSSISLYEPLTIKVYPAGDYPYYPEVISEYNSFYYPAYNVCVQGDYSYIMEYQHPDRALLKIVDVSDPSNPTPKGFIGSDQDFLILKGGECVVRGDYLYTSVYVYTGYLGGYIYYILAVDISDPWNPEVVGKYRTGDFYYRIALKEDPLGEYLYLVNREHVLIIYVEDGNDPFYIGEMDYSGLDVDVQGDYLYVTTMSELYIFNTSTPYYPVEVGIYDEFPLATTAILGDIAIIREGTRDIDIVDISDPTNPIRIAEERIPHTPQEIEIVGDYVYFAPYKNDVVIYDFSDPLAPFLVSTIETKDTFDIYIDGDCLYVTDLYSGLRVFNVSNPETPFEIGRLKLSVTFDFDVQGDYAFIADGKYGCTILDISDKQSPLPVVSYNLPEVYDITVIDNYAYLVGKKFHDLKYFFIMDFSNPLNPVEIGSVSIGIVSSTLLTIDGNYAYISTWDDGLIIVDFTIPSAPVVVSTAPIPCTRGVAIDGDYAYVAGRKDGLLVIDISDPGTPAFVANLPIPSYVTCDVAVKGDYAFLAANDFSVVDIANPEDPQLIATVAGGNGDSIYISGDYAYVTEPPDMVVYDISDPENPEICSITSPGGRSKSIKVVDNHAYITSVMEGLKIIELW